MKGSQGGNFQNNGSKRKMLTSRILKEGVYIFEGAFVREQDFDLVLGEEQEINLEIINVKEKRSCLSKSPGLDRETWDHEHRDSFFAGGGNWLHLSTFLVEPGIYCSNCGPGFSGPHEV